MSALPNIGRDFRGATLEDLSWILNGYAIAYAALLVFFGRLAERHRRDRELPARRRFVHRPRRRPAPPPTASKRWSRFGSLQAAGAALMTPTSLGLLLASFPPERRGGAVRTWTAIGGLAAALGPARRRRAGDGRAGAGSFSSMCPIGLVAMLIGWWKLPRVPGHDVPRPDALGARCWSPAASAR